MNAETLPNTAPRADLVPFRRALRAWFAISLQTFGGPAGQIAVMQRTLVDERRHPLGPVHLEVPELGTLRPVALGITVLAAVLIFRVKVSANPRRLRGGRARGRPDRSHRQLAAPCRLCPSSVRGSG